MHIADSIGSAEVKRSLKILQEKETTLFVLWIRESSFMIKYILERNSIYSKLLFNSLKSVWKFS